MTWKNLRKSFLTGPLEARKFASEVKINFSFALENNLNVKLGSVLRSLPNSWLTFTVSRGIGTPSQFIREFHLRPETLHSIIRSRLSSPAKASAINRNNSSMSIIVIRGQSI